MGQTFIDNLEDNGWHGHEFESTDIGGLYFIGTKENSEIITSTKEYAESAQEFMQVSGLFDYIENAYTNPDEDLKGQGFTVSSASFEYYDGIPYYRFDALGKEVLTCLQCYVVAVPLDEIMSDEKLLEKYNALLGGFY